MMKYMKKILVALFGLLSVPGTAMAAPTSLQSLLTDSVAFLNKSVLPLLFSLAFLFFIVNVARYFIIGGANEDSRKKARLLALWGIIAFVVMISIWGIVNILVSGLGVGRGTPLSPDAFQTSGTGSNSNTPVPTGNAPVPIGGAGSTPETQGAFPPSVPTQ
jgi:hypothetical protein